MLQNFIENSPRHKKLALLLIILILVLGAVLLVLYFISPKGSPATSSVFDKEVFCEESENCDIEYTSEYGDPRPDLGPVPFNIDKTPATASEREQLFLNIQNWRNSGGVLTDEDKAKILRALNNQNN